MQCFVILLKNRPKTHSIDNIIYRIILHLNCNENYILRARF